MSIRNAAPLHGYHRRRPKTASRTAVTPRTTLPPMSAFAEAPAELREALETWYAYAASIADHQRQAAARNASADTADARYRDAVQAALAAGTDPAKVKPSRAEQYRAEAAAHVDFAKEATRQQTQHGYAVLGPLLEQHAADLVPHAEAQLEEAAAVVRRALADLQETWTAWTEAFQLRVWLSRVAFDGGTVPFFHGSTHLPPAVTTGLDSLENQLGELDRLKHDEAEVTAWREGEDAARATLDRMVAQHRQQTARP